jgi:hypothetical protein
VPCSVAHPFLFAVFVTAAGGQRKAYHLFSAFQGYQ